MQFCSLLPDEVVLLRCEENATFGQYEKYYVIKHGGGCIMLWGGFPLAGRGRMGQPWPTLGGQELEEEIQPQPSDSSYTGASRVPHQDRNLRVQWRHNCPRRVYEFMVTWQTVMRLNITAFKRAAAWASILFLFLMFFNYCGFCMHCFYIYIKLTSCYKVRWIKFFGYLYI